MIGGHLMSGATPSTLLFADDPWYTLTPNLTRDLSVGLGIGLIYVAISRWLTQVTEWGRTLEEELLVLLQTRRRAPFRDALSSSIAEEIAFRSLLLHHVDLLSGALLFAAFHLPTKWGLVSWMMSAFFMGIVFGATFLAGFSVLAPVTAHFTINYLNLHYLKRRGLS